MYYAIVSQDKKDTLKQRLETRPKHLARLEKLKEEGRLIAAGPNPAIDSTTPGDAGFTGSTVIAEFDSLEDAQKWADADPYNDAGVYASTSVKPFILALP
ncbi:Protein YciI [Halomonadaceae bacterium LMG 33818]|uniref:YciI family protein n=1 Tax=Cernens ardua TaxID=3402176 RepID=UPI003EDBA3D1